MADERTGIHRPLLLKALLLLLALAAVLAVIFAATRGQIVPGRTIRSHTFFEQFIVAGGPIVWFVLLPMSLIMVYLAAEYGLTIRRKKLLPAGTADGIVEMIRRFGPAQLETRLADRDDFVSIAVAEALAKGRGDWFRMRSVLAESLQEQAFRLIRKIEWVNLIGNVSPMVGLFGTVFGMIKLFNAIVIAGGQPQPAQLAEGISVALVTTFWGLFIAIPALALHGIFRNRIETLISDAVTEAENVMPRIRPTLKKTKPPQAQAEQSRPGLPIRQIPAKSKPAVDKTPRPS